MTTSGCRNAGHSLMLDVRQAEQSVARRVSPLRLIRVETTVGRPSVTGVLGRRDLPSRGLPASSVFTAPLKRCRVDAPSKRPPDHARFVVHHDDVTDDEDDWNKENRQPDCSREPRRRHTSTINSRCAGSPANHVYHTLEPTADCRPTADTFASPVYETIKCDDVVDASVVLCDQRLHSKLPSTSHLMTQQRQRDSNTLKTKKRVTFNVSIAQFFYTFVSLCDIAE